MDEGEILKLIDYDGATFIPVGLFENPRKLANKVVPREFYIATPTYAAIEYYEENMLLTTKMDMWALGIIIYELILVQVTFNERISVGKITQILLGIGDIYLGMQRNSKGMKQTDESLFANDSWAKNNCGSLMAILNVWQKYPKTALIITNLLHPDKEARMSAIGIKNFLSGFCLTEELKSVENVAQLHFFNRFSFGEFYQMVNDKIKTVCCSCNSTAAPTYEALLEKTERVIDCWDEHATRSGTDEASGSGGRASEGLARGNRAEGEASRSGGRASEDWWRGAKRAEEERAKDWREGSELRVKRAEAEEERAKIGGGERSGGEEERANDWREGSELRVKRAEAEEERAKIGGGERSGVEEERANDWREGSE
ncbi:hypothetical protein niasHT_030591 [Heterodera trifolii]|uniref:Protein kinase domain-containing protein n=1 Tax=Heterodera trifolii TaxID=157864 RepID=A0ABD2IWM3_9BILA